MTYDVDHERCELSKSIDCKNGERPNWTPPEGCRLITILIFIIALFNKLGLTASITERTASPTTVMVPTDASTEEHKQRTTLKVTTIFATHLAHSRMLLPSTNLIENTPCIFEGNVPDAGNCQCMLNESFPSKIVASL